MRILLIDDDDVDCNAVTHWLPEHEVVCRHHPISALALLQHHQQDFDLIVCDVHLPGTLSAPDFINSLRKSSKVPVIRYSGHVEDSFTVLKDKDSLRTAISQAFK